MNLYDFCLCTLYFPFGQVKHFSFSIVLNKISVKFIYKPENKDPSIGFFFSLTLLGKQKR